MIRDFVRSLPTDLAAVLLVTVAALILVTPIWLIGRALGRRSGAFRFPAWLGVAIVLGSGPVTLLLASLQGAALLGGYVGISLLAISLGHWHRRRSALFRAIRRMNAGDHTGAIADLHARIDRQRLALGLAPGGGPGPSLDMASGSTPAGPGDAAGDFNPYAAPSAGSPTAADRVALANDLNTLGVVESNRGDWAAALANYDEAAAIVGDAAAFPVVRGNRGYALIELGRVDEGLPLLRAAIDELRPADRWVRAQFLTALADKLIGLGQVAEVGPLLDRARHEGRRERVYPRSGKRAWLARLDNLRTQLASASTSAPADPNAPTNSRRRPA